MTSFALRYQVLATDYDGTLADDGSVAPPVLEGLKRLKASGRRIVLVTGRELEDLKQVFPALDVFDRIVAENGGVLYRPASGELLPLSAPPDAAFIDRLRQDGVTPLYVGNVVVATVVPYDTQVVDAVRALGLDLEVSYNKGAVMVLPAGVDKGSGLRHALEDLDLSDAETIGIGDAENDDALLDVCSRCIAVANALPSLSARAHSVTSAPAGEGVLELIDDLLASDLRLSSEA